VSQTEGMANAKDLGKKQAYLGKQKWVMKWSHGEVRNHWSWATVKIPDFVSMFTEATGEFEQGVRKMYFLFKWNWCKRDNTTKGCSSHWRERWQRVAVEVGEVVRFRVHFIDKGNRLNDRLDLLSASWVARITGMSHQCPAWPSLLVMHLRQLLHFSLSGMLSPGSHCYKSPLTSPDSELESCSKGWDP
jgi:hypothetical protein